MKAFVYTEEVSETGNSDKPVTYYVLAYSHNQNKVSHSVAGGCFEVRSVKKNHIIEEIEKIQKQRNVRILGKIPPNLSPVEKTVLGSNPVKITRKPYDLSSLIGK